MNVSNYDQCSSGCESGWTMYFDDHQQQHSNSNSSTDHHQHYEGKATSYLNHDQEDLSMVSDASSGPPNYQEYNYDYYNNNNNCETHHQFISDQGKKKNSNHKNKTKEVMSKVNDNKQQSLCLDDTASSPVFHFSEDNVAPNNNQLLVHVPGFSKGFSASHHEDESTPKKNYGFFKSSTKGKSSSLLGRKRR